MTPHPLPFEARTFRAIDVETVTIITKQLSGETPLE